MTRPLLGIAATAAATGLSVHTLRAWERRYGFPKPARATGGERFYAEDDVARLTLIRRLIDQGHRVSAVIGLPPADLQRLAAAAPPPAGHGVPVDLEQCLQQLSAHSVGAFRRMLHAALTRQGLGRFILDTLRPLVKLVGDRWADGTIQVFQEHLFAEQVERLVREAMSPLDATHGFTVLLTTLPGETHRLGLLMLEAVLRVEGASCIPLGVELPPAEIAKLCAASQPHAVALSFSAAYRDPSGRRALSKLRHELPVEIAIWAGGRGAGRVARGLSGIAVTPELEDGIAACRSWGDAAKRQPIS